jgi:hypothetical protein
MMSRQPEGMRVTLIEEAMLESSGILSGPVSPDAQNAALPERSVQLFLMIAGAGEGGLPQSKVPTELRRDLTENLLPLEMQGLVTWERDKRGRLAYLVLTWKGEEALEAARPKRPNKVSLAARRRASCGA